jgi:hypothetical protein
MMARRFSWIALAVVLVAGSVSVRADAVPFVQGSVATIELCPQSICGVAIFTGVFAGQIESRRAVGSVSVVVKHEDLPEPGFTSNILSGAWQIQTFNRTIHGGVQSGTLLNNGNNTFTVHVTMTVAGSPNTVSFTGLLNHNTFPPTLTGQLGQ